MNDVDSKERPVYLLSCPISSFSSSSQKCKSNATVVSSASFRYKSKRKVVFSSKELFSKVRKVGPKSPKPCSTKFSEWTKKYSNISSTSWPFTSSYILRWADRKTGSRWSNKFSKKKIKVCSKWFSSTLS